MKKTAPTTTSPLVIAIALFALVLVGATALAFQWRQAGESMQSTVSSADNYGPLGYGRGQGGGQGIGRGSGQVAGQSGMQRGTSAQGLNKENCLMDGCLLADDAEFPVATLDEKTIEYLNAALADERKALATYEAAMAKFGRVKPFVNIARAEEQHISMLLALFDKYGVKIPQDTTKVGALPTTLAEVCAVGVTAEIDNDALYQRMIPELAQQDIQTVFTSLARASKEMHLPAFERCSR